MIGRALLFVALLLGPHLAAAQTCAPPHAPLATAQPEVRRGHEVRFDRLVQAIQQRLKTRDYVALGLGDSVMQRWREKLTEGFGVTALNAGIGGDTTESLLWRLRNMDWSRQHPRFVLIHIGGNNIPHDTACDTFWGIRAVVTEAHRVFPSARVIISAILPRGQDMMQDDAEIHQANQALGEAARSAGFAFFDAHDAFLCSHKTPCDLVIPPMNRHPTPKGFDVLDGLLRPFVAGLS